MKLMLPFPLALVLIGLLSVAKGDAATPGAGNDESRSFLAPPLQPGQVSPLVWTEDRKKVDPFAVRIGLPTDLTKVLKAYVDRLGISNLCHELVNTGPVEPGGFRFINVTSAADATCINEQQPLQWHVMRPESKWQSNMHWLGPSNEASHEDFLRAIAAAGFDTVLEAMGSYFRHLDGLVIQGAGVLCVSHCTEGFIHHDFEATGGRFFNVIFPLILEEDAPPELSVVDRRDRNRVGVAKYDFNTAYLVGDDTKHGTAACDYRETNGLRMVVSLYVADINEENLEMVSEDDTAIFPVPGKTEWTEAQKGRHWGNGNSLANDPGRKEFVVLDDWGDFCRVLAKEGRCDIEPYGTRSHCLKSCNIYLKNAADTGVKGSSTAPRCSS